MPNNQMQGDGWNDLLGLYTGVLQNDSSSGRTQMSNRSNEGVASANNDSRMQRSSSAVGVVGVKSGLQSCLDVVPVDVYNRLPPNFNPNGLKGVNLLEQSNQKVGSRTLPNCGNLDQNFGTSRRNLGEINLPRKVDSMAELMSSGSTIQAPLLMGTPNKGTYNTSRLGSVGPQPVASIQMMCTPSHTHLHQNQTPLVEHNNGNYNLQELSSGRLSVPYCQSYNLNLPPRLESGESSIATRQFSFGPVTPAQLKQSKNCQIIEISDSLTDETYCTDMYKLDNAALSPQPVRLEREQNKSLLNSLDALPQQSEILPCEKNNSDVGNGGIDLNKTPQQKTPKRRKIRPKVVIEGKPRRTPKPVDTKSSPADNKPKRKYVRKNGNQTSTPQSIDVIEIAESSGTRPAQKSCKRALNFDLDSGAENKSQSRKFDHQTQNNGGTNHSFNLNLDSNNADWSARLDRPSTSFVNHGSQDTFSKETQQIQNTHNIVQFNEVASQESMPLVTTAPAPPAFKNHTLNIIARILNARKTGMSVSGVNDGRSHVHQHIRGSLTKLVTQSNSVQPNLQNKRPMPKTVPQLPWDREYVSEQGSKREYTQTETIQPKTSNLMGCQLWSHAMFEMGHCDSDSSKLLQNSQEKSKMKMIGDKFYGATSCSHSGFTVNEGSSGLMGSIRNKNISAQNSLKQQNGELRFTGGKGKSVPKILNDKLDAVNGDWFINYQDLRHEFQQQHALSELQLGAEQMAKKASYLANEQNTNFLTPVIGNPVSASGSGCNSVLKNVTIKSTDPVTVKKRPVGRPKKVPAADTFHEQKSKNSRSPAILFNNGTGSKIEQKTSLFINDISDRMKYLSINDNGKAIILKEQTALVPYKADGTIIPFEEFDPMKKKRPRPRVDLDPETNRLWNLLMGNEGSENAETMDAGKQKFWENERQVFRGRVDSFIARMHLVQGDRRFSKWKGSVVDSVIGVFLTQNVSDHLSSSAFMSLVAKFPLKSGSSSPSQNYEEVHVAFPDGTTSDFKMIKEPTSANSSVMYPESSVCRAESVAEGKSPLFINDQTKKSEEDIISSQSSSESIVFQASEDIRSSSGSNSEAEDGWNFGKNFGNPTISEHPERIATLQQSPSPVMVDSMPSKGPIIGHQVLENPVYRQSQVLSSSSNECSYPVIPDVPYHEYPILQSISNSSTNTLTSLEKWEADILAFSGKESVSSLASAITNGEEIFAHECVGQNSGIRFTRSPNETLQFQPSLRHDAILREHRELQTDIPDGTLRINGQRKQGTFQLDSASLVDPKNSAEASIRQGNDNWKHTKATPLAEKEQAKQSGSTNSPILNARKRKAEKEPFDWDSLRKEAQSRAGTRGRSWVTLDSIDYEVLRNANVREISDTIKERGMNNLLAERMKDFLNRLVRDHGKVDLEWLRDVAPDKAKEYLLSIRGLGLKSVECVRLLTLHHLAFPVDTNVGRIAVRLGWVPLQPLPESLQLHLLELYPVLESIQKYLWPRLCKLDQETLYELHYQMITFGKVFCTKREPNCNACPMRAECRHFASAFASARLSLPAPEEKQVVSSAVPICTARNPDAQVKPLSMLLFEENVKETQMARDAGPLIEEPASPEPPTELLERDIEDAFYEDPDEIPVIKLNVKEFTTNLQNIMQEKLEFGEGDMSRALVALSPEFASIPVPKLKHVSRLRTEHQVYELPDSHPLLTGMDLREPDDPSPYLLAIWTPGETADSVQPPDRNCSTQEGGGLCINSTCFSCSSAREAQAQTVRGTILIPCRTAMRGSFPLNGTYFQVNEVFADHESSLDPIDVPRSLIWNLSRRTVFFGTSVSSIFKGLSTEGIQYCFWKGFVCVRGFDRKTRAPRPLKARLHLPASKMNEAEREKKLGAKLHVGNANQNPAL